MKKLTAEGESARGRRRLPTYFDTDAAYRTVLPKGYRRCVKLALLDYCALHLNGAIVGMITSVNPFRRAAVLKVRLHDNVVEESQKRRRNGKML